MKIAKPLLAKRPAGKKFILAVLPVCWLLSSCAAYYPYAADDPRSAQVWTPSAIMEEMAGSDPLEPFNRAMFTANDVLMRYAVRPFSWVYGSILPKEVIKRIEYASENMAFPGRFLSCLLQAKFTGSGIVLARFLTNSTVGLAGLFDPADAWLGLPPQRENMGKAFASWGIGPGFILVIPLSSAITFRDQIGAVFDSALDIKFILPYASAVAGVNRAVNSYDGYVAATETGADPYELVKMGLVALRYINVHDYHCAPLPAEVPETGRDNAAGATVKEETDRKAAVAGLPADRLIRIAPWYRPQSTEIDTMKYLMFTMQGNEVSWWVKSSLWNTDFVTRALHRTVKLRDDAPPLPYHLWAGQESTAPLVALLPGLGGHHKSPQLRALAEILAGRGYAVALLPSVFNPAFMTAANHFLPGNTQSDAVILRRAIAKIAADIKQHTALRPVAVDLFGWSMGGLHTLFIADLERKYPAAGIRKFVAVNPPVDLRFALTRLDSFFARSREWTRREFFRCGSDALFKYTCAAARQYGRPGRAEMDRDPALYSLPLTSRQAAVLTGISYRLAFRDLLLCAKRRRPDFPALKTPFSWWNRGALYREIDRFSGMDYALKCLLPEYRKTHPGATADAMNAQAGLRAIETTLREHPAIRVIHNADDPLLSSADRDYLTRVLNGKITWFDCGGHLGNLFVREYVEEALKDFPPLPGREKH